MLDVAKDKAIADEQVNERSQRRCRRLRRPACTYFTVFVITEPARASAMFGHKSI
jgi:hypothetical protein